MIKVKHKKGQPAPPLYIMFLGWMPSTWAEDGWHDKATGKLCEPPLDDMEKEDA